VRSRAMSVMPFAVTVLVATLLAAACASSPEPAPADPVPGGRAERGVVLLAASRLGALGLDLATGAWTGFDREGHVLWSDGPGRAGGAEATCLGECTDAVLSGDPLRWTGRVSGPDPAPLAYRKGKPGSFPVPGSHRVRVLHARSPRDAVLAEEDRSSGTRLVLVRAGGDVTINLPGTADDIAWSADVTGTLALAFSAVAGSAASDLLWFARDRDGWLLTRRSPLPSPAWMGCIAGDTAVTVGPGATMMSGQGAFPLESGLDSVGECRLGTGGGLLLRRVADPSGAQTTAVRAFDARGVPTWSRDLHSQAEAEVDPSGELAVIISDGAMEIVGPDGRVIAQSDGVQSARFTADGELVTASRQGVVSRLTRAELATLPGRQGPG
jgi:hypothetical protein